VEKRISVEKPSTEEKKAIVEKDKVADENEL
jgi:hypothetical protein